MSGKLFSKHVDRSKSYYSKWFLPLKTDYTDQQCGVLIASTKCIKWLLNSSTRVGENYPWWEERTFSQESVKQAQPPTYTQYLLSSLLLLFIVIFFRIQKRDKIIIIIIIISAFGWLGLDCGRSEIFLASRRAKHTVWWTRRMYLLQSAGNEGRMNRMRFSTAVLNHYHCYHRYYRSHYNGVVGLLSRIIQKFLNASIILLLLLFFFRFFRRGILFFRPEK